MHVEINESIRSILILEDEMIVAMLMEDLVRDLGVTEIHICPDVASALDVLRTNHIDCAVLDLWLRDRDSMEVADMLVEKGIPFVFSSGSDATALADRHADRPMISKPFLDDDLKLIILDTWSLSRSSSRFNGDAGLRVATSASTD
jgi:CheY-like chemotaxis protein